MRIAFLRERFAEILDTEGLDLPPGTLDPFIDYVADKLARAVPEENAQADPE